MFQYTSSYYIASSAADFERKADEAILGVKGALPRLQHNSEIVGLALAKELASIMGPLEPILYDLVRRSLKEGRDLLQAEVRIAEKVAALKDEVFGRHDLAHRLGSEISFPERGSGADGWLHFKMHTEFRLRGAYLKDGAAQRTIQENNRNIAGLGKDFLGNMQRNAVENLVPLYDEDVDGLPDAIKDELREHAGRYECAAPYAFLPADRLVTEGILIHCKNSSTRTLCLNAWHMTCLGEPHSSRKILLEILEHRSENARLLGKESHADLAASCMGTTAAQTTRFLLRYMEPLLQLFSRDMDAIAEYLAEQAQSGRLPVGLFSDDFLTDLMEAEANRLDPSGLDPADIEIAADIYFRDVYGYDREAVEQRLTVDSVIRLISIILEKELGYSLRRYDAHPRQFPYELFFQVVDEGERAVSVICFDLYRRPGKRGLAWMAGVPGRSDVIMNFVRPTSGDTHLTLREFIDLLHEFGHALMNAISKNGNPRALFTADVAYVEFPSTWFETMGRKHLRAILENLTPGAIGRLEFTMRLDALRYAYNGLNDQQLHSADPAGVMEGDVEDLLLWKSHTLGPFKQFAYLLRPYFAEGFGHLASLALLDYSGRYGLSYFGNMVRAVCCESQGVDMRAALEAGFLNPQDSIDSIVISKDFLPGHWRESAPRAQAAGGGVICAADRDAPRQRAIRFRRNWWSNGAPSGNTLRPFSEPITCLAGAIAGNQAPELPADGCAKAPDLVMEQNDCPAKNATSPSVRPKNNSTETAPLTDCNYIYRAHMNSAATGKHKDPSNQRPKNPPSLSNT